jgi:uncharacterized membrane protein YkvA (DUF1232 family)
MMVFKDFIDSLEENLESYNGEYEDFISYCPKLFNLLCNIFSDKEISPEVRCKVSLAIAYFVVPDDTIPENVFGPYGYIDDIYISVYMLKEVIAIEGYEFLEKYWDYYENLRLVINECIEQIEKILDQEEKEEILKFIGL